MNNTELLQLFLSELVALKGKPLTWGNVTQLECIIDQVSEVATESTLKAKVLQHLYGMVSDYKEILIRRAEYEYEKQVQRANGLHFVAVLDEWEDEIIGYRLAS